MRILTALALTLAAAPALAHPASAPHLHETDGFWIAAVAFTLALGLTTGLALKAARARK